MRYVAALALIAVPGTSQATAYPSLSCVFTEPFFGVDVWPGGASLITPTQRRLATTRTLGGTVLEPIVVATIGARSVKLAIKNRSGNDGMSDFDRPLAGEISGYLPTQQTGACLRYPDGTTPRPVVGIAPAGRIAIRDSASPRAKIVGQLGSRGRFWAFPEPVVSGWVRGAFENIPVRGSGSITVAAGWINARHLGRPGIR